MSNKPVFHLLLWSCLLMLLGVMGWLSFSMLETEKRRLEDTSQIRLVEQSRLALWRMDSLLATLISAENNRSPGDYFQSADLRQAGSMNGMPVDLTDFAKLYFQINPKGQVSSPQSGAGQKLGVFYLNRLGVGNWLVNNMQNISTPSPLPQTTGFAFEKNGLDEQANMIRPRALSDQETGANLSQNGAPQQMQEHDSQQMAQQKSSDKAYQQGMEDYKMRKTFAQNQNNAEYNVKVKSEVIGMERSTEEMMGRLSKLKSKERVGGLVQSSKEQDNMDVGSVDCEWKVAGRLETAQETRLSGGKSLQQPHAYQFPQAIGSSLHGSNGITGRYQELSLESMPQPHAAQLTELLVGNGQLQNLRGTNGKTESYKELSISSLHPQWHHEKECFLIRRIADHGQTWVQGIWLDWSKLSTYLLASVADILPNASLTPVQNDEVSYLTLAGIPAILNPGHMPALDDSSLSIVWNSILMAWGCGLLALFGVIGFMIGLLRLSERRAVFVSAVTHELRTPLTTFNMYTEMLSSGLVPKGKEPEYVNILKHESCRLTHLVDNVLSYARVEKNSISLHTERISIACLSAAILDRISPRLSGVDMDSQLSVSPELQEEAVLADLTAVEQIMYNLADNVAKYACCAGSVLQLSMEREKRFLVIRVTDEGKGIPHALKGRLFRPFSRSAEEAAGKQPGVGLGLALSRELARSMGGDLYLENSGQQGCRFVLKIPLARE